MRAPLRLPLAAALLPLTLAACDSSATAPAPADVAPSLAKGGGGNAGGNGGGSIGAGAGKIAFVSYKTGKWEIWRVDSTGSNPIQLTFSTTGANSWPTWSPSFTKLAFVSSRESGINKLYTMSPDGTGQVRVHNPPAGAQDAWPAWSPDGAKLAFVRTYLNADDSYQYDLMVLTLSTGVATKVWGQKSASVASPAFSPDGARLLFARYYGTTTNVWSVRVDGTDLRQVTSCGTVSCDLPKPSPDGTALMVRRGGTSIARFPYATTWPVAVTSYMDVFNGYKAIFGHSWLAGMTQMALVTNGGEDYDVYRAPAAKPPYPQKSPLTMSVALEQYPTASWR